MKLIKVHKKFHKNYWQIGFYKDLHKLNIEVLNFLWE